MLKVRLIGEALGILVLLIVALVRIYAERRKTGNSRNRASAAGAGPDLNPANPDTEELKRLLDQPEHEQVLNPQKPLAVTFFPEENYCTFLLSSGLICIAEAGLVTETNYMIKWQTASWYSPMEGRLHAKDLYLVAKAFFKIDQRSIRWPFSDQNIVIMSGENIYTL